MSSRILGYYCIDKSASHTAYSAYKKLNEDAKIDKAAVSIDARNIPKDLALFPSFWQELKKIQVISIDHLFGFDQRDLSKKI